MKRRICLLLLLLGGLALPSCVVREPVRHESQLREADAGNTLVLLLRDGTLLRLTVFSLRSDTIVGSGTAERDGRETAFYGTVVFDDIEYAQLEWLSATGTALFGVPAIVLTAAVLAEMTSRPHVDVEHYTPSSGGSSCPYVYSWDGERYVLEAETFGTSLGRALQRTTRHMLPSLREENGQVHLKIANERPETHMLDHVRLSRVRHARGTRVQLDPAGHAWQVGATAAPLRVERGASGLARSRCVFARSAGARRALLLVTARNRETAKAPFQELFDWLGDDALRFIRDIEQDHRTVDLLRHWQQRAALGVSIVDGDGLRPAGLRLVGRIDAEATAVSFTRAIPIDLAGVDGDTFTVALDGIAEVWDVEDVSVSWDAVDGLEEDVLPVASCTGPDGMDIRHLLAATDGRYCTLLPPQAVDLRFRTGATDAGSVYSYRIEASGYLHLWYMRTGQSELLARFAFVPPVARRAFVRELLDHPSLVLALLEAKANTRPQP